MSIKRTFMILAILVLLGISTAFAQPPPVCGTTTTVTLWAGQDIDIGTVSIWNDPFNIFVKYSVTAEDWYLGETHLHLCSYSGYDPSYPSCVRRSRGGPIPGKMQYKMEHDPGTSDYTYVLYKYPAGRKVYVTAHAELYKFVDDMYYEESAWAGPYDFPYSRKWAYYFYWYVEPCGD